jgi:hypothetical protein
LGECAVEEGEEEQGVRDVEGEVEGVVAPDGFAGEGVVQREGEIRERAAGDGEAVGREERGGEMCEARVLRDRGDVVEDEGDGEGVGVGEGGRDDEEGAEEERGEASGGGHAGRVGAGDVEWKGKRRLVMTGGSRLRKRKMTAVGKPPVRRNYLSRKGRRSWSRLARKAKL